MPNGRIEDIFPYYTSPTLFTYRIRCKLFRVYIIIWF